MEQERGRRNFIEQCLKSGGACCALLAWNRHLSAQESPVKKQDQGNKLIDLRQLAYCGIPCVQVCELYKATQENDAKMKKLIYEKWEMKKKFGIEFEADKISCYTCKPGNKPQKIGMAECEVRNCAMSNGMESCVQCKKLASCDKEFWKIWPQAFDFAKKVQARYLTQPGGTLKEIKHREVV